MAPSGNAVGMPWMQLNKVFGEYFIELGYNYIADCKNDETLSFFLELRSGESKESGKCVPCFPL